MFWNLSIENYYNTTGSDKKTLAALSICLKDNLLKVNHTKLDLKYSYILHFSYAKMLKSKHFHLTSRPNVKVILRSIKS